jgi:hypothetical protein
MKMFIHFPLVTGRRGKPSRFRCLAVQLFRCSAVQLAIASLSLIFSARRYQTQPNGRPVHLATLAARLAEVKNQAKLDWSICKKQGAKLIHLRPGRGGGVA